MHWLMSLGAVGLFGVAIIDSSVIPLPLPGSTDLFLLLLTAHRGASALTCVLLAFSAWAGSIVGGYTCWSAGRKGGEAALEKRVPPRFLNRLKGWVQRHGSLSIALAAFLPPPIPLLPFLLAAGALGITRTRFLISYAAGRLVRYGLLAWLGATYGRHFVRQWEKTLNHWTAPILYTYAALVAAAIGYGLWQATRGKRAKKSSKGNAPALVSDAWDAAPPQP
jgi:membrane protein DedA with SNARE-associated domain